MPLKLLDRYVIEQYFWMIISSSLIVLAVIFCTRELSAVLEQVVTAGTPASIAILISLMCVPAALMPCIPAGLLVATMMLFYKQSVDGEILGLAVNGVSFGRMLRAPIVLALIACLFCFVLQEFIIPHSRKAARELFVVGMYKTTLPVSKGTKECYGAGGKLERIFLVPRHEGNQLQKVIVLDFSKTDKVQLLSADSGLWQNGTWILKGGHSYDIIGSKSLVTQTSFAQLTIPQQNFFTKSLANSADKFSEMTTSQLIRHINSFSNPSAVPPNLVLQLHQRLSKPLACLFLVLAGVPLAIVDRRTRISKGFLFAGLLIFFYFMLQAASDAAVTNQRILPVVAAWIPNAACLVLAMILIRRKSRQI